MHLGGDTRYGLYKCLRCTRKKYIIDYMFEERERLALRNNAKKDNYPRDLRGTRATIDVFRYTYVLPEMSCK